jgi:hypothetical protein
MHKHLSIAAAAALAVAGMAWNVQAQETADTTTNNPNAVERAADKTGNALENAADKTGDALKTAGDKTKGALSDLGPGKEEIHDVLAQVAESAMTKEGLDDLVERFVDADRNRLGQNQDALKNQAEIDGLVAQLQQDWKAKYTHEFDIKDEGKVFDGFAMIMQGEIPDRARTAGERVSGDATTAGPGASASGNVGAVGGSATVNPDAGTANVDVDNKTSVDTPKANTDGQTAADTNRNDPGRNIGYVTIAASHGLPELQVPLIHEAGGWKIDIPDSVDANKLRDNVKNALTKCKDNKDKWPTDENEAYRAVSHKILAAIMDKPLDDAAQKASDQQPATPAPAANPQ